MSAQPKSLSKSAQSIQDVLSQKGLESNVIELTISARTAKDAATALGCTVAQIVKSLIFKTKETNMPILVLASGVNRVNEQALEEKLGTKIVKADADYTRDVTGFAIGGIPPVGHKQTIPTYIDEDLLQFNELWAAAGTPNAVFRLESTTLAELTGGTVISIK
jgi:prolyl-tRNA editing enzyme YbaK/EbsC (Cys-tRNA(Pro) deacylase)